MPAGDLSSEGDVVPFLDTSRHRVPIELPKQHAILFRIERESRWRRLLFATVHIFEIGTYKFEKCRFCENLTFDNSQLGQILTYDKKAPPIVSTRGQTAVFSGKLYDALVWKRNGGGGRGAPHPFPLLCHRGWRNGQCRRGLRKLWLILRINMISLRAILILAFLCSKLFCDTY